MSTSYQRYIPLLCLLFLVTIGVAQVPQGIHYQTVVRDGEDPLENRAIEVRFTIIEENTPLYSEIQALITNNLGLINAVIGHGTVESGNFLTIPWQTGDYKLKVEVDLGDGYLDMGTNPFQSVPFSMYAEKAGTISNFEMEDLDDVGSVAPVFNQVLKWNGSEWEPAFDETTDADHDPTNELQSLSISGSTLSLSNGGSVNIPTGPTYSAGSGISISGTTIINTGDLNPSDDIISGSGAGGDLTGSFPNPTVRKLRGRTVASTAPTAGQVLKWDGTKWAPAIDNVGTTYSGGSGISVVGGVITNTGDINASDDLLVGSVASGDLSGAYPNPSVTQIQGKAVSGVAPNVDEILKWNGSQWKPAKDEGGVWTKTGSDIFYFLGHVGVGLSSQAKTRFHVGNQQWVLFGKDTTGTGAKMIWMGNKGSIRIGGLSGSGTGNLWSPDSVGSYSFAAGLNVGAKGYGTISWGRSSQASGNYSTAGGYFSKATGVYSMALGYQSVASATASLAMGYKSKASGSYATALGYGAEASALYSTAAGFTTLASGRFSTAMGRNTYADAYASFVVGRYNVGGGNANSWLTADPIFEIGIGSSSSLRKNAMTVLKNGNIGIGTTTPGSKLTVNGQLQIGSTEIIKDGGSYRLDVGASLRPLTSGNRDLGSSNRRWRTIYATNGVINTSDLRSKENIVELSYGIEEVMALRPVSFTWKTSPETGPKLGLIAQEVKEVIGEVVQNTEIEIREDGDEKVRRTTERMGIYYADLVPVLIKATQQQQELIREQKEMIKELERRISNLEKR